ncbi:MAG: ubiquinol-cytochrome c reductase iron-sulfur subunit [Terriglobales bacterium]
MSESPGHPENADPDPSQPEATLENRRSFLGVLVGLGSVFVTALLSVPLVRFTLFPLLRRTTELKSSPVGDVTEFSSLTDPVLKTIHIEQVDGWRKTISEKAVYVTKDSEGKISVLSSVCPHLGCTVPWSKEKRQFICPCHGAVYSPDGARVSGPSRRGMDTLETSVQDGQLEVQFQYFRQLVPDKEIIG